MSNGEMPSCENTEWVRPDNHIGTGGAWQNPEYAYDIDDTNWAQMTMPKCAWPTGCPWSSYIYFNFVSDVPITSIRIHFEVSSDNPIQVRNSAFLNGGWRSPNPTLPEVYYPGLHTRDYTSFGYYTVYAEGWLSTYRFQARNAVVGPVATIKFYWMKALKCLGVAPSVVACTYFFLA